MLESRKHGFEIYNTARFVVLVLEHWKHGLCLNLEYWLLLEVGDRLCLKGFLSSLDLVDNDRTSVILIFVLFSATY